MTKPEPSKRRWIIYAAAAITLSGGLGVFMGGLGTIVKIGKRANAYYEILEDIRQRREKRTEEVLKDRRSKWRERTGSAD